jgi:hypothetical protein
VQGLGKEGEASSLDRLSSDLDGVREVDRLSLSGDSNSDR